MSKQRAKWSLMLVLAGLALMVAPSALGQEAEAYAGIGKLGGPIGAGFARFMAFYNRRFERIARKRRG